MSTCSSPITLKRCIPRLVNDDQELVEGMVVNFYSQSIGIRIAPGEVEASLNMLTPNSSPNSGSAISFMYTRTLLRPYSSAFSVWPTGLHNHSKNHSVAMGGTICYDEQLLYI